MRSGEAERSGCEVLHDESCELEREWECHCYERALYRELAAALREISKKDGANHCGVIARSALAAAQPKEEIRRPEEENRFVGHCRECGIEFAYVPGVTDSRERCLFCSRRRRRERIAELEATAEPEEERFDADKRAR